MRRASRLHKPESSCNTTDAVPTNPALSDEAEALESFTKGGVVTDDALDRETCSKR